MPKVLTMPLRHLARLAVFSKVLRHFACRALAFKITTFCGQYAAGMSNQRSALFLRHRLPFRCFLPGSDTRNIERKPERNICLCHHLPLFRTCVPRQRSDRKVVLRGCKRSTNPLVDPLANRGVLTSFAPVFPV